MRAAATALAALTLAACGGSDDGGGGDPSAPKQQASGTADCVSAWNDRASADQRAKASLSHRGDAGEPVIVGRYDGEPFSATGEGFDASGSPTTADIAVEKGDCVAVDLTSSDSEVNWAMALADKADGSGRDWYFVSADPSNPLAEAPPPVAERADTTITGFGEEAKLSPQP